MRTLTENRRRDAEIAEKVFGVSGMGDEVPRYSTEFAAAESLIRKLLAAKIETIIGCFPMAAGTFPNPNSYSVELRQWRKQEGVEGDPHTGRSRVTFVCITGAISLPDALSQAVLRPETLAVLRESAEVAHG